MSTSTTVEMTASEQKASIELGEQTLRTKIAAIDRKIEAQRKHIGKLELELGVKRAERASLVRQRIALLTAELPPLEDGEL